MEKLNVSYFKNLRKWFHKNAELSLKEFNTSNKIKEELLKLGVKESEIQVKVKTGLQIDLKGTGKPSQRPRMICLRADIDALPIKEINTTIGKLS